MKISGLDNNLTRLYNRYLTSSCGLDFTYKEKIFLRFYLFIFRERGREGETEREKH